MHAVGWDPDDVDSIPPLVWSAVHEAGHTMARAALDMPGALTIARPDGTGISEAQDPGTPVRPDAAVAVCLAGALGEGELIQQFFTDPWDLRLMHMLFAAVGDLDDVSAVHPAFRTVATEINALALVRAHWPSTLRLARVLLDDPSHTVNWQDALDILGPGVVGTGWASQDARAEAVGYLAGGQAESLLLWLPDTLPIGTWPGDRP